MGEDLPKNAALAQLAFPDLGALRHGDGVDAMCGSVEKAMTPRGYRRISAGETSGGINCRFITPGLSLLTDGAIMMSSDVASWRGDTEDLFQRFYDQAVRMRDAELKNPSYASSKIEHFPAGDGGYIFHRVTKAVSATNARTDTEAVFRSGDDLMWVALWGNVHRAAKGGERVLADPLTEEITYREISDIVKALSGDGQPRARRRSPSPTWRSTRPWPRRGRTRSPVAPRPRPCAGSSARRPGSWVSSPVPKRGGCQYEPPDDGPTAKVPCTARWASPSK